MCRQVIIACCLMSHIGLLRKVPGCPAPCGACKLYVTALPGGHWPLGDPSTAHHLRSIVSLPMLPSFKVLCILLSVCLWRSHRPRSCTLGGPIACVLSTPGGPTAMITCLNIDDTTTLAPIPAVGPLHTMLRQSSLMHDLCSNCIHFCPGRAAQEPPVALPPATPCSHGGLLASGGNPHQPADRHDSGPPRSRAPGGVGAI